MCTDIFGPKFDISLLEKGIADTNTYYGGLDIQVGDIKNNGLERKNKKK